MSPLLIHGVKRGLVTFLILTAFFLLIYAGLLSMYWLYPTGGVVAILILSGIVVLGGISDLGFAMWGRYQKYRKMTGRLVNVTMGQVDPFTNESFDRLTGFYDEDGVKVHKPLVGSFNRQETKSHGDGRLYQAWLASNGDLVLIEKQD